jgi:hypothetical protein
MRGYDLGFSRREIPRLKPFSRDTPETASLKRCPDTNLGHRAAEFRVNKCMKLRHYQSGSGLGGMEPRHLYSLFALIPPISSGAATFHA